ncbi:MAG TPA: shikimate kinase [Terriglobales bacterium]|nr:shikimate kinase [Terriglobales bacterium]
MRRALALLGFMGSGKSTVGTLVAERTGARYIDLDAMIEERCGMTIAEVFERRGEAVFRDLETQVLPDALTPGTVVALGGGTPLRDANWALIRQRAVTVWLEAPLPLLIARATTHAGDRPLLRDRGEADLRALLASREARYGEADHRLDGSGTPEAVAEEVCRLWPG